MPFIGKISPLRALMNMSTARPEWLTQVLHFGTTDYLSNPRPRLDRRAVVGWVQRRRSATQH